LTVKDSFRWRHLFVVPALAALTLTAARAGADACAAADADALAWLDKMSRSLQQVSYHGIVTFQRGDEMQAMQVSHSIEDGVANERLTELTGQGAEVVRVDHPLECVHPGNLLLQLGANLQAGECGVAQFYRFGVVDGQLVAGRRAVQIRIEPRDMYRYGYILELDRDTGLLLKSATIGRGNKVLESFQFASLSYSGEATPAEGAQVVHEARHSQPGNGVLSLGGAHPAWSVNWLPQGFTATDQPADVSMRRTFTDGLAVFSVFLEILSQGITPGEGVVRSGGTISYTRGMHMSGMPVLVTVIGEVPLNTARMVADSVAAVP
jgi:sigma-E factor negative regulatory protein RseB